MSNTWIVTSTDRVGELVQAARALGAPVRVVAVGSQADNIGGVDAIERVEVPATVPIEALASALAAQLPLEAGDVVLVPNRQAERVLAGAIAVRAGWPLLTGVKAVQDGAFAVARFGGISRETVRVGQGLVAVMDAGASSDGPVPAAVATAPGQAYPAQVLSEQAATVQPVNLGAAERVVGAGRGFKAEADLQLARDLAGALGAEVACSRPLAEGADWMGKETYVGVSGAHIHPQIYVAVGISGQLQHMSGCAEARTIIAVNTDEAAPVFEYADYGVVGDLYQVIPALVKALA